MSVEPKPAGTVVLVRDAPRGLELLLLQRAGRDQGMARGVWVFPGGQIEPGDRSSGSLEEAARRAAVREAAEEAGLELDPARLVPISRWITPEVSPRRFDAWFFLASVDAGAQVRVDGAEICAHRWVDVPSALAAHHGGEIRLAPPTFVTVSWLAEHTDAAAALERFGAEPLQTFVSRICTLPGGGACILYAGDAGYEAGDPERPGARHRLWTLPGGWRYERTSSDR